MNTTRTVILFLMTLAITNLALHLFADHLLRSESQGALPFIAQTLFQPEALFHPALESEGSSSELSSGRLLRFDFTPKYAGTYMVGLSGIAKGHEQLTPTQINANLSCAIGSRIYKNSVLTVSPYSGTSHAGSGAVIGLVNMKGGEKAECQAYFRSVEFQSEAQAYRIIAVRVYQK